jgi:ParB family chromosome partitioning protein
MIIQYKVEDLPIDQVTVVENTRTELDDMGELMNSMKQSGLLQPIGVHKNNASSEEAILLWGGRRLQSARKLGWQTIPAIVLTEKLKESDFIILNTIENIQRKDISPVELGRGCSRLREMKFSVNEIAAKLGIPKARVLQALNIYQKVPVKFRDKIGYIGGNTHNKKGQISASLSHRIISNTFINSKEKEFLLDEAKKNDLTLADMKIITALLVAGMPMEEAVKNKDSIVQHQIQFLFYRKKLMEVMQQYKGMTYQQLLTGLVTGKIAPIPGLIYYEKTRNKRNQ